MYPYSAADAERLVVEKPKESEYADSDADRRSAFTRDRARVLHSAALRRLADKTQVVGPRDGDTPRTRLTHSLEVGQIARSIGAGVGVHPDLAELAGLTHDIGHPPYGHNGERALDELAADAGGFEGNAQTLRILTRLEPKVLSRGESVGLNLTRASLDAACKYPRTRTNPDGSVNAKYSCYDADASLLEWIRAGHSDACPSMEAQVMDWADDIAYSVHDVEDGILSGRISLKVLWDLVELADLAGKGAAAFGGSPEELLDAADHLRQLPVVAEAADFDGSLRALVGLKRLTSELVGRYVTATLGETHRAHPGAERALGRTVGTLSVSEQARAEVMLLKTIAVLYVMEEGRHLSRQNRQRDRMFRVYDYLSAGAPGTLDPMYGAWWERAEDDAGRCRVVVDNIASMTESRLERLARESAGFSEFLD